MNIYKALPYDIQLKIDKHIHKMNLKPCLYQLQTKYIKHRFELSLFDLKQLDETYYDLFDNFAFGISDDLEMNRWCYGIENECITFPLHNIFNNLIIYLNDVPENELHKTINLQRDRELNIDTTFYHYISNEIALLNFEFHVNYYVNYLSIDNNNNLNVLLSFNDDEQQRYIRNDDDIHDLDYNHDEFDESDNDEFYDDYF